MLRLGLVLYILGLTVFYIEANFDRWWWHEIYYIWDKGLWVCLLSGLYYLLPKQNRRIILPLIIFSIIRFLWQIVTSITKWDINDARAVAILFILLSVVCLYLTIKGILKWERK